MRVTELLGYARVSTNEQDLALQLDALAATGREKRSIFKDAGSGAIRHRPQLERCFDDWRAGDTLVVWRLDRLGRSLRHLVELVAELEQRKVGLRSLTKSIDTTTPAGPAPALLRGARRSSSANSSVSGPVPVLRRLVLLGDTEGDGSA